MKSITFSSLDYDQVRWSLYLPIPKWLGKFIYDNPMNYIVICRYWQKAGFEWTLGVRWREWKWRAAQRQSVR